MWKALRKRETGVRILFGLIIGTLAISMLVYLVPQGTSTGLAPDAVAEVGGAQITVAEVQQQLQRIERGGSIPAMLRPLYAQQVLDGLVFQQILEYEAKRLGIRVTEEELAERVRLIIPAGLVGGAFVGQERYAAEVQQRTGMGWAEFEELVRRSLLEEKFRRLVLAGLDVTPEDVAQEFRRRNEKVKLEYVLIKPEALEAKVTIGDADLPAYFSRNKTRYVVPERRVVRYALLDLNQLRSRVQVNESELRAFYNENIGRFRIQNRVHIQHILFKSIGKTDAEVEETRKKADDVLKKAKKGGKFEDLAKQYSEDTTKDKGGDIGWIVQGQTVPEFERVAFSLRKGAVADLVKTQYGFHIIKVLDKETARTQSLEEVRAQILPVLTAQKADQLANDLSDKVAGAVRKSTRGSLDDIAKQFGMTMGETRPVSATDPVPDLGNAPELRDAIFRLRVDELSLPVRTERGTAVLSVKQILASHPGTLDEVRDKVTADYRREQSGELARMRVEELGKRAQAGENLSAAAKALGFEVKASDSVPRTGNIPEVGPARQLAGAFNMKVGQTGGPVQLATNWLVYRVSAREEAKPEDLEKQRKEITQQVLQEKRQLAYQSFQEALKERMAREGKLKYNRDNLKRLTSPT